MNIQKKQASIPVTVLSGFLGAGKTTLLRHVLKNTLGMKIAVIVNDMASVNIDALLIRDGAVEAVQAGEELIQMSNGCICCTLRQDLIREVSKLARSGRFDYILIESSGISEPLPVAQSFTFDDAAGRTLRNLVRLDTMVTVVDGQGLVPTLLGTGTNQASEDPEDQRDPEDLARLLVDQLEWADVIVISREDLLSSEELSQVSALVKRFNPRAKIYPVAQGKLDPRLIMGTGLFDIELAESQDAWEAELKSVHTPETEEYGIRSMVYQARRPFHPLRLYNFIEKNFTELLRAKGFAWIAGHDTLAWHLGKAGIHLVMEPAGYWWVAVPRKDWPKAKVYQEEILAQFQEPHGDRRQELVLITKDADLKALREGLDACLIQLGEELDPLDHDPFKELLRRLGEEQGAQAS